MKYAILLNPQRNGIFGGQLSYGVGAKKEWGVLTKPDEERAPLVFRTFEEVCEATSDIVAFHTAADTVIGGFKVPGNPPPVGEESTLAVIGFNDFLDKVPGTWGKIRCIEASPFSAKSYIACGRPADALVYHKRDQRAYSMCKACAFHNRDNRGGTILLQKEGTGL